MDDNFAIHSVEKYLSESYYGRFFACSIFNTIWYINWDAAVYVGNTFNFRCTAKTETFPYIKHQLFTIHCSQIQKFRSLQLILLIVKSLWSTKKNSQLLTF